MENTKDFMELNTRFGFYNDSISLHAMMNINEDQRLKFCGISESNETVDKTVLKLIENFPIQLVCLMSSSCEYTVIRGENQLKNLIAFVNGEKDVVIRGEHVKFDDFSERNKSLLLDANRLTLLRIKQVESDHMLDNEELARLINNEL